jgi:NAD(P)-dependent dehydrogenase (short-subunit alcohol dehydrogenase family)
MNSSDFWRKRAIPFTLLLETKSLAKKHSESPFFSAHHRSPSSPRAKLKKDHNLDVKFVQLDVTDTKSVEAAAATIEKNEGRLDVLVNNAGVAGKSFHSL